MKTINKILLIILMSIFIFLVNTVNYNTSAYTWQPKGKTIPITGEDWRSEYYCINHSYEMDDTRNHTFKLTHRVNYYSDDTSDFKRQIGYLFYLASMEKDTNNQYIYRKQTINEGEKTYIKLNGYGKGKSGGYKKTKYQLVLWQLLWDFSDKRSSCTKGETPFYKTKVNPVGGDWTNEAQQLYEKVKGEYKNNTGENAPCFAHVGLNSTNIQLDSTDLKEVNIDNTEKYKYAHFKINSLTGTITEISIVLKDKTVTIAGNASSNDIISLYKKSGKNLVSVNAQNIKSNDVVYVKVDSSDGASSIDNINGKLKCDKNTGWAVNIEKWTNYTGGKQNNNEQSFIRVVVWKQPKTGTFEIKVKKGSLQIRKLGVSEWDAEHSKENNTDIPLKSSFKIYCVNNNQWIKGDAIGEKEYTDEFNEASSYKTEKKVTGKRMNEITIDNLDVGYRYIVYEVDVEENDYKDSNGIPRIVDVAWAYADETGNDKIWRRDDGETDTFSWIEGNKEFPGFGNLEIAYNKTKQVDVRNIKIPKEEIEIRIKKIDSNTKQILNGVGLQLYKLDAGWVANDDDGNTYFAENYSNATTYTTGEDGKISVKDLTVGTYYIYENKTSPTYSLDHQRTKYPDSADPNGFAGKKEYSNMVYLGQIELKEEDKGKTFDNITYEQYSLNSKLTILKKDGTLENVPLSGTKIKIFGNSNASNGWIKYTNDDGYSFETYENATEFITDNSGIIELKNIPYGKYYIFETEAANKKYYNIKEQDGYHKTIDEQGNPIPGTNNFSENTDWVYLGTATIGESAEEIQFNAINKAYVSLKGKVWIDNPDRKLNGYNNIYDGQDWTIQNEPISKDELKKDITVNLYSNKDGKNKLIANTTTNQNGEYEFKTKANGEKFTYWELAYCYVEFVYDNEEYITVVPFEGENLEINSKAQEKEIISTGGENNMGELYDGNLSGIKGDFPGKAVTYQGSVSALDLQTIENNKTSDQSQRLLTGFYNEETYTIENINLGLIKKIEPSFSVGQQIEYVKIKRGNYTFKYKMRR